MGGGHAYGNSPMGASSHGPSSASPGGSRPSPIPVQSSPGPSRGKKK